MKKLLLLLFILSAPSWATVACSSGTWSGTTCTGGTHPLTYTITGTSTLSLTDLQASLDDSCMGDTITLEANKPMTLTTTQFIKIQKVSCGTGYRTLTTSESAKLPADGTRITPAYLPLTAIIQKDPSNVSPITNYISTPWMVIYGGKKYLAEHFKMRGITMRISPLASRADQTVLTQKTSTAYIFMGKDQAGNALNGTTGPAFFSRNYSETTLRSDAIAGDGTSTPLHLTDVTGLEVGMTVAILPTTGANSDWCVIATIDVGNNDITCDRTMTYAHPTGNSVNQSVTSTSRDMPDDIVLQHCLLISDHMAFTPYGMYTDGRRVTVKDSFLEGFRGTDPTDARGIIGSNGCGPAQILNNYIDAAAENIMWGASTPSGDWEMGSCGSATDRVNVMYNYLPKYLERFRLGPWDKTVRDAPAGHFGIARLVLKGKHVVPSSFYPSTMSTSKVWVAKNTGIAGTTEPSWPASPAVGATIVDGGVTWWFAGGNTSSTSTYFPFVKNDFEIKAAQHVNLQYNVMDGFPDNQAWNGSQPDIVNVKASSQGCDSGGTDLGIGVVWPDCYRSRAFDINVLNNKMVTQYGGINFGPASGIYGASGGQGDWTMRNNIIIHTEINLSGATTLAAATNACVRLGAAKSDDVVTNVTIMNNTCYNTFSVTNAPQFTFPQSGLSTTGAMFPGNNRMIGNIWPSWSYSYHSSLANDGGNNLKLFPCIGVALATCATTSWDKNIINGAITNTTNNYRSGTVMSNCSTTSACNNQPTAWDFAAPSGTNGAITGIAAGNRVSTFKNRTFDLTKSVQGLTLNNAHLWKRSVDGKDPGADPSQVPDIIDLQVTPTDRTVLFTWRITAPMEQNIITGTVTPCVVEVWSGDYEPPPYSSASYAGELGTISTYYRQDADDADRNIRRGLYRMIQVGHTANLTASTLYGYRLQCAGDAKQGSFTTLATLSSTSTQTIKRVIKNASTASMQVQYGTSYSRSTDVITGSTASTNCTSGNLCSVSFTANKGSVYYVRWLEKSSTGGAGTTLLSGPVDVITVTQ